MKEYLPHLLSAGALLLAIVNAVYSRKRDAQSDLKEKLTKLSDKVEIALNRLTVIETKAEIYFKGMSVSAAQALHSPHTKELDILLEKFQRDEIQNEKDLQKLKGMLQDVVDIDTNPSRVKYALDILTLIHVRFEIGGDLVESFRQS